MGCLRVSDDTLEDLRGWLFKTLDMAVQGRWDFQSGKEPRSKLDPRGGPCLGGRLSHREEEEKESPGRDAEEEDRPTSSERDMDCEM